MGLGVSAASEPASQVGVSCRGEILESYYGTLRNKIGDYSGFSIDDVGFRFSELQLKVETKRRRPRSSSSSSRRSGSSSRHSRRSGGSSSSSSSGSSSSRSSSRSRSGSGSVPA